MMTKPQTVDCGVTFALAEVGRELTNEDGPYGRDGHSARTLVRTDDLRIVLVALRSGKEISEHHADVTASVQTLTGCLRLQLPDRSVEIAAGQLLVLGEGLTHNVKAEADSTFLLTLGWRAK